ncbi:MAG: NADP-dependent malic enzyme [Deltaproteobacteria bacterium]|jgi:malate dehydrogenase (oxaloacetate-decarboxylating)|nr:NADP-dependent malic enzyme [Deltaproteobacteria bacterium]
MDYNQRSLELHYKWRGKLSIKPKPPLLTKEDLALAYTPGVAEPCRVIQREPVKAYELTGRWNTVAVVTDGSAVLGLGNIGALAGLPVMEGKCVLFKDFGDVDAFPLCLDTQDPEEIVQTVRLLAPSFGGVNLEDISAPRCFDIEKRLKELLDIPVFHDDQHGTALVVLAAIKNALKITGREPAGTTVVISGAGAAGTAIARLLNAAGLTVIVCDRQGAIHKDREGLSPAKVELAALTNPQGRSGPLSQVLVGADILVGVSGPGLVTGDMIKTMRPEAIVLAMANPEPEIWPTEALRAGARVVGSGRSDLPNQINNVLAFPGIFRGALDVRARDISQAMILAAAAALADLVGPYELGPERIVPSPFDIRVVPRLSQAVAEVAKREGLARV